MSSIVESLLSRIQSRNSGMCTRAPHHMSNHASSRRATLPLCPKLPTLLHLLQSTSPNNGHSCPLRNIAVRRRPATSQFGRTWDVACIFAGSCASYMQGGSTKLEEAQPQHVLHAEQAARKQSFKRRGLWGFCATAERTRTGLPAICMLRCSPTQVQGLTW